MANIDTLNAGDAVKLEAKPFVLPLYILTIFLSAFLLFSVQPMFAKMVLPRLGGSPGVWSVAMVFFQACLLLGYSYSHLLITKLSHRKGAIVHGMVLLLAFVALPLAIPDGWSTPPETGQSIWLIGLFTACVGLPFFAVSANGPLLQAWFARSNHKHAEDPYFLYGASNIGSFASLILYIIFFEPNYGLGSQNLIWAAGFAALATLIAACAMMTWNYKTSQTAKTDNASAALQKPTFYNRICWILLSFIPSGLLVSVTAYISTDVAAAPFLWVIPLALFLLTFSLAFQQKQWLPETVLRPALIVSSFFALAILYVPDAGWSLALKLGIHIIFFFIAALYCHTRMADMRPKSENLTEFYMYMSIGGVIGGIFASLIALALFESILEYPLLIIASLLALKPLYGGENRRELKSSLAVALLLTGILISVHLFTGYLIVDKQIIISAIVLVLLALSIALRFRSQALGAFCVVLTAPFIYMFPHIGSDLLVERTFFGVTSVAESRDGKHHIMNHGTTLHGAQKIKDDNGNRLTGRPEPLTYYHRNGPLAKSLFAVQERENINSTNIGIIGLGTGSMLCYSKPNENWTAFEIDKSVVDMAKNPALFNYVSECGPTAKMSIGDARITIADEPAGHFDYLMVDAFSSNSIPVHLLTREAIGVYFDKMAEDGILAMHLSNRFMELPSVVAAIAKSEGLSAKVYQGKKATDKDKEHLAFGALVVVLARDESYFGNMLNDTSWKDVDAGNTAMWTDDYSNVLAAILRKQNEKK